MAVTSLIIGHFYPDFAQSMGIDWPIVFSQNLRFWVKNFGERRSHARKNVQHCPHVMAVNDFWKVQGNEESHDQQSEHPAPYSITRYP